MPYAVANVKDRGIVTSPEVAVDQLDIALRLLQKPRLRCLGEVQEVPVDVQDEARRIAWRAIEIPTGGLGNIEALLGTRDRDEGEPPLLFHALEGVHLLRREDALTHAAEKDVWKLQALRRMDRHQLHPVVAIRDIHIAQHRDTLQVRLEIRLLAGARLKGEHRLLKLREIIKPVLGSFRTQQLLISGFMQDARQHLGNRPLRIARRIFLDERDEFPCLCAPEDLMLQVLHEGVIQCASVLLRILLEELHATHTEIPLRDIRDAPEAEIILIDDHPKIAQRILDLHAPEKLYTGVDRVRNLRAEKHLLDRPRNIVRPVHDRHFVISYAHLMQGLDVFHHPLGFLRTVLREMTDDRYAIWKHRDQILLDPLPVFPDQSIGHPEDLRRRTVILHHHDRLCARMMLVEIQEILHVRTAPGVDGLVRIAHDEEVMVVGAQHFHEPVLQRVDVLELVDLDVHEPLLPLLRDVRMLLEDVETQDDEIVVINRKGLPLLVEIAVKEDVVHLGRLEILLVQLVDRQRDHVEEVARLRETLPHLEHIPRACKGLIPERQPPLLIDDLQHLIDVTVVEHHEALRIADRMTVLLKDVHTEAMEGADIARIVIARQLMDPLPHLIRRLIREGHTKNVPRQHPELRHEIRETMRQRPRLPGPRPRDHPHEALRRRHRLQLRLV